MNTKKIKIITLTILIKECASAHCACMLKIVQLLDTTSTAAATDVGKASRHVNFLTLP